MSQQIEIWFDETDPEKPCYSLSVREEDGREQRLSSHNTLIDAVDQARIDHWNLPLFFRAANGELDHIGA